MSRAPELYNECGGRVGQGQYLSVCGLLPNTRLAAPLCEKETKKRKNRKRKGRCKPMTVVCQCRNKNPEIIPSFKYLTLHNLDEASDIVRKMSFIIRIIILVPCWNSKGFPRFSRYFLPVLDAVNALTRVTSSLDVQSPPLLQPKALASGNRSP